MQFAIDSGIVDITTLQAEYDMNERKKYLEMHTYNVWQGKNGKWYTYLTDYEGNRVQRKRNTKSELEDLIVQHYKEDIRIKDIFKLWIEEKERYKEVQSQTIRKYKNEYKRFFVNNKNAQDIMRKQFKNISEQDLKHFIRATIADMELTQKAYSGLRLIINALFIYAKDADYTTISITQFFGDLKLSKNIFRKVVKDKEKEVYNTTEIEIMTGNLRTRTEDIRALGLLLLFETGMRIGELAGLKKCDIVDKAIHVRRTEVIFNDENGKTKNIVQDYPKSHSGNRYIILTEKAQKTVRTILDLSENGEYLFMDDSKRIRAHAFRRKLMRVCKELGIDYKSNHKIRKTYGTILIDSDVDDSIIAEQMGHSDINTTRKYYYYSNKREDQKREQICNALNAI